MKIPSLLAASLLALVPLSFAPVAAAECVPVSAVVLVAGQPVFVQATVCDDTSQCASLDGAALDASECDGTPCAETATDPALTNTTVSGCGEDLCLETQNEEEGAYVLNAHACGSGQFNCNILVKYGRIHVHC